MATKPAAKKKPTSKKPIAKKIVAKKPAARKKAPAKKQHILKRILNYKIKGSISRKSLFIGLAVLVLAVGSFAGYSLWQGMSADAGGCGTLSKKATKTQKSAYEKCVAKEKAAALAKAKAAAEKAAAAKAAAAKAKVISDAKATAAAAEAAKAAATKAASIGWKDGPGTIKVLDSKNSTSASLTASACKQEVSKGNYKVKARVKVTSSTIATTGKISAQVYPAKGSDLFGNQITVALNNISTSGWSAGNVISTNWISVTVSVGTSGYTIDPNASRVIIVASDALTCA